VAFAEDDSYDWDEVYTGKGQFWFSIQRDDIADAGGEFDGTTPDDANPYSNPTLYNWTHIGSGAGAAASNPIGWNLRAGTAGTIGNSILTEQKAKLIEVQDKAAGINDAYSKLVAGELKILNNIFYRAGAPATMDATATGIIRVSGTAEDATATALVNHLNTNKNSLLSPYVIAISRQQNELLDPRVCAIGAAYTTPLATVPSDPFFTQVNYKGAFSSEWGELWVRNWTALDRNNHLVNAPGSCPTTDVNSPNMEAAIRIYPNPTHDFFLIESSFSEELNVEVLDMSGRIVTNRFNIPVNGKSEPVQINALAKGMYIIKFYTNAGDVVAKKLIVE
jgi:hypothetical protein